MTFKDDDNGKTNWKCSSWLQTVELPYTPHIEATWDNTVRPLHDFTADEIHHLIWLLQEELKNR